ncbi:MAG TPA: DinB family protein [Jatrophihabitantaceae bacterium]|jgi:uncharacterized damage-inducible protein DinB
MADSVPWVLDDPPATTADPRELLLRYLDWYRDALLRKIDGLSDEQLRTPVEPLQWAPLGLVQHLGWVERRWLRWGFAAEHVAPFLDDDEDAEWQVAAPSAAVLAGYLGEVARSRTVVGSLALDTPSRVGGRFPDAASAPTLGRILFHLLQEYARHVGQLDVARELIDGVTGE